MKPVEFEGSNVVFAKDQPEYLPLPAFKDKDGNIVCCWELSNYERFKALISGKLYLSLMTFNKPLTPHRPSINNPLTEAEIPKWLDWVNFIIFQWFFTRLAVVKEHGEILGFKFLFAWPLTRWIWPWL